MIRRLFYAVIGTVFFGNFIFYGQQGKVDVTFNTLDDGSIGDGFDAPVQTLSLQPDQNLIVGGEYLNLNGIHAAYLTRLTPDGTIDESFHTGNGFNGKVYASCIQPDGKIIVGGNFTTYNGISAGMLIRLNSDGSVDPSFNTSIGSTKGIIYDIALQSDGKIIICGSFTKYNNATANYIARILPNGSLDISFAGSGSSTIKNVKVLDDGKILLSGNFTVFNGTQTNRIVRLNSDGRIDPSFNVGTGFDAEVSATTIQSDGKILVGGKFTNYNGIIANRILRMMPDGSIDNTFVTGSGFSSGGVLAFKINPLGDIMVGGSFTGNYDGTSVNRVCLLDSFGVLKDDLDFGSGPATASVFALETDAEGAWYIGGSFLVFDGLNQGRLAKIDADGEYDTGYLASGIGLDNSVYKILALEDGKSMAFGNFIKFNGNNIYRIVKLLDDGSSDPEFNSGGTGADKVIKTAVLQQDGKIIIGGNFSKYNETKVTRIARILSNGAIDLSFNITSGCNSQVYAVAIQPDERIIVAGGFTKYNDVKAGGIVRLLPNGSIDASFDCGAGANAIIEAVLLQPDGKILVAGRFTTFDGFPFARLVRLNADGSIDPTFAIGVGFNKNVYALALQSDQKIIVGGSFLSFNGVAQKRLLRLNPNGNLDATFESGSGFSNGDVRSILVQPDDRILVGGTFSGSYKNTTTSALRLIRLLKTGSVDTSFDAKLNNKLFAMSFSSDFKLLIGGDFNSVSGISKHRIARLKLCLESTVWNGISWSNGFPSGGKEIFFKDDCPNLTTADVCSCTIDEGKKVILLSGNTLGVEFSYLGLGTLILEDSANLYQSDDDIVNSGIIHLKRNSSPILKSDYTYWSSPVDNQKLEDLSPNTSLDKFLIYNPAVKNWKVENSSNVMMPGVGYIIQGPSNFSASSRTSYQATFKGLPHNGKIEVNMGPVNTYNLIGNPYPSTLNADIFLKQNASKIKGTIYYWTHNTPITNNKYTSDDYAVYNLLGGVGTRGALSTGINDAIPDNAIGAGQAFFVASLNNGTVEFNDRMRMKKKNSSFFKSTKYASIQKDEIDKQRIWLNLKNEDGLFKQILIGYIEGATNEYDINYDAETMNGNKFANFYSISENKSLIIQGRVWPFDETDLVSIGYMSTIGGNFSFSIDHVDNQFEAQNVFIEDKELNITHNLKEGPYIFKSDKGTFNSRFELKYIDKELSTAEFSHNQKNVFVSVKDKQINIKTPNDFIEEVEVYDLTGKLLYQINKINSTDLSIQKVISENGVLLVKVILENGFSTTQKVIF